MKRDTFFHSQGLIAKPILRTDRLVNEQDEIQRVRGEGERNREREGREEEGCEVGESIADIFVCFLF